MIRRYDSRIGRRRTWLHLWGTPVLSVMFGSILVPILPIVAQSPFMPPFGLMILIAWRVLRPEIWPLWIGFPLGLFDDVMSGQPIGSAPLIWTLILLALDIEGQRHFWRDYWHGWIIAALALAFAVLADWLIVHMAGQGGRINLVMPQLILAIGLFPFVVRLCAVLDRWRLP